VKTILIRHKASIFILVLLLLSSVLLISVRGILFPFIAAVILSYLLIPTVDRFKKLMIPDCIGILVVYFYTAVFVAILLSLCVPIFLKQSEELIDALPAWSEEIRSFAEQVSQKFPKLFQHGFSDAHEKSAHFLADKLAMLPQMLPDLFSVLLSAILTPILAFYMIRDRNEIKKNVKALFAPHRKKELSRLFGEMNDMIRKFVFGYLVVAFIIGVLSSLLYVSLGLEYSLVLGVIMGFADLIPYFGPFLGAIPALIVAMKQGRNILILTLIGILILQQLENTVITPKVMGDRIGLNPVLTIFVVLAGNQLFGIFGAILSVPISAIILLMIRYIYTEFVGIKTENF